MVLGCRANQKWGSEAKKRKKCNKKSNQRHHIPSMDVSDSKKFLRPPSGKISIQFVRVSRLEKKTITKQRGCCDDDKVNLLYS